jgi:polar amino acid transport system substrate-binding protein
MADGMPYVEVKNQELQGGLTHRLSTLTSQRLGVAIRFVETPNKRVEQFIQRGRIHVICNNNPEWLAEPQRYHWSPMLYQEVDVLLLHRQQPPISSLKELHDKVPGTRLGYVYNAALMEAFARKRVTRQDEVLQGLRDEGVIARLLNGEA